MLFYTLQLSYNQYDIDVVQQTLEQMASAPVFALRKYFFSTTFCSNKIFTIRLSKFGKGDGGGGS